jgi:hypothetical protein
MSLAPALTCSKYQPPAANGDVVPVCQATEGLQDHNWINGTTSDLKLRSRELPDAPEVTILDTSTNDYLIYSPEPIKGQYECSGQSPEELEIKDLVRFTPQDGCTLQIPEQKLLGYNALENAAGGEFPMKLTISTGNLLAEASASANQQETSDVLKQIVTHFRVRWIVYLITTGGAVFLILTCCISITVVKAKARSQEVHALRADLEQTYVVERSARM